MPIKAKSELDLLEHRAQYPALANRNYFNYGGQGPLCQVSLAKISENYQHIELLGAFSCAANDWINAEIAQLKDVLATELQVEPQTLTITENTTVGCNIALWSVNWQKGDHLLLSDCEHPGIVAIALALQVRFGIEISYFPLQTTLNQHSNAEIVELVRQHLQPQTRMIVINHICWNTGQILPLRQISQACHAQNVLVTVDAAQSVGALPLNLTEIEADFYAFTGHKWWCGPLGVGGLYIRPAAFAQTLPTFTGWRGLKSTRPDLQWRSDGQKFEVASSAYPLYGALMAAIAHANQWGSPQQRYNRMCELSHYLWQELTLIPEINCLKTSLPESGLVAFTIRGKSPTTLMQKLETEHHICIRSIPDPNCLRASVHYLTTIDEIAQLISVLKNTINNDE